MNEFDDKLIDKTFQRILDKGPFDINNAEEFDRNFMAIYTAQGIIDNGGLEYFFEKNFDGVPEYDLFINTYDMIGAPDCAEAIREALLLFPNSTPHHDLQERADFMEKNFNDTDKVSDLNDILIGNKKVYPLLAEYVRKHNKDGD